MKTRIHALAAAAMACCALPLSTTVAAQTAAPERIEITGSAIRRIQAEHFRLMREMQRLSDEVRRSTAETPDGDRVEEVVVAMLRAQLGDARDKLEDFERRYGPELNAGYEPG